tara:strand:- start:273 stop:1616 length:1344 start_codon:yes stop_codon:yes gene_type:complete
MLVVFFNELSFTESMLVASLAFLFCWELYKGISSRNWFGVFRPTIFLAGFLTFYCIAGPLRALANGEGSALYRGLDHRSFLIWGWIGALVFYSSFLLGFNVYSSKIRIAKKNFTKINQLHFWGLRLCQIGFISYSLVVGIFFILTLINPIFNELQQLTGNAGRIINFGVFNNYFAYAVNLLIPGNCLMLMALFRGSKQTLTTILWFTVSLGLYTSLGFRYRLVLLIVPAIIVWFMAKKRRPSLIFMSIFLSGFLLLNGLIGMARLYSEGISLARLESQREKISFLDSAFIESSVFLTTSAVIEQTPVVTPHIGLEPVINALLFPIPRQLVNFKPDGNYQQNAVKTVYGTIPGSGAAFLCFGEYFLMAGWPSVIFISFLMGCIFKKVWNWFISHHNDPFAQCIYALISTFLYIWLSRGYMAQFVLLFCFSVAPLFAFYGSWRKAIKSN